MKRFIYRILLFSLPFILLSNITDRIISTSLANDNLSENSSWKAIFNGTVNSEIVIYGSSRAIEHIDPNILTDTLQKPAYNLGIYAYPFGIQYLRHRLYFKHNPKPRLIIHSLDFLTFTKRKELYNSGQFLPYMLYDTLIRKYTRDYDGFGLADYMLPMVRYYGRGTYIHRAISLLAHQPANNSDATRGYVYNDQPFNPVFNEGAKDTKPYYEIAFDEPTIKLFDAYLKECRDNHVKVIFVYSPEYVYGQHFIRNRKQLFNLIGQFSKKYNVPFYDYSNDLMCTDKTYFYNSEHLNKTGSQLFSRKLAADLKLHDALKF